MYLRATPRRNKDGSTVRYLQLAHNVWDPLAKRSKAQVIYNFGREDEMSRAAIERLVASLSRFLAPEMAFSATAGEGFDFLESRPLGGTYVLDVDDWGLAQVEGQAANDLMDVVDDRAGVRSTVIASQLPVSDWHHLIADPSIADAVLDRLVHRSVRIELTGESMRRRGQGKDGELT